MKVPHETFIMASFRVVGLGVCVCACVRACVRVCARAHGAFSSHELSVINWVVSRTPPLDLDTQVVQILFTATGKEEGQSLEINWRDDSLPEVCLKLGVGSSVWAWGPKADHSHCSSCKI